MARYFLDQLLVNGEIKPIKLLAEEDFIRNLEYAIHNKK